MLNKIFNLLGSQGKRKSIRKKSSLRDEWAPESPTVSPEELCEIDPGTMSREAIRKHLAVLYKRHNNAVSSLNPELRAEALQMLDAIVECRLRYVDPL